MAGSRDEKLLEVRGRMLRAVRLRDACRAGRGDEGGAERTDVKERVLWACGACAAAAALLAVLGHIF